MEAITTSPTARARTDGRAGFGRPLVAPLAGARRRPTYSIQLIPVGEAEVRGPEAFWMARWDDWVALTFHVALIRSEERTILVNAGPPDDLGPLNAVWTAYAGDDRAALRVRPEHRLIDALAAHGVRPDDVDTVVITPLTAYSIGGLAHFERATIAFSRTGWLEFMAPAHGAGPISERETEIPASVLARLVTDWWPRVRLLADEDEIAPGIGCFRAGVHGAATLALSIPTAGHGTVVYSDAAFRRGNVEDGQPLGLTRSLAEAHASYARIAAEADVFLPAFEPALLDEFPGGRLS